MANLAALSTEQLEQLCWNTPLGRSAAVTLNEQIAAELASRGVGIGA